MKKIIIYLFYFFFFSNLLCEIAKKTVIVPFSDAYPLRYNYHTKFQIDRLDPGSKWLCKGMGSYRFQHSIKKTNLANVLFSNPLRASSYHKNSNYNAQTLGLGFNKTMSESIFTAEIINNFITCGIEIGKVNSPYYIRIGIPIQRSEHKITMTEKYTTDNKVIKGGLAQEYQPNSPANYSEWKSTPSSIISSLPNIKSYLKGQIIGNMEDRIFGLLTECPLVLWALADIYIQIGYDSYKYNTTFFGPYLRGVIPTTPTTKSMWNRYLFYPVIGNVNRSEIGIGLNGNTTFFENETDGLELHFDGYIGYLFATEQMRPYDLNNGFFTRYGQVKVFNADNLAYKNRLLWGVDLTTQSLLIGNALKSEIVLDLLYQKYQSYFNIGYSFKSQSKENANCNQNDLKIRQNNLYGFCPQQFVQTPNPVSYDSNNWTTDLVTPRSSMTTIDNLDKTIYEDSSTIVGTPMETSYALQSKDINMGSGLMDMQILNIFFIGYSYESIKTDYNRIFSVKGSIGLSPENYYTPEFAEIFLQIELQY